MVKWYHRNLQNSCSRFESLRPRLRSAEADLRIGGGSRTHRAGRRVAVGAVEQAEARGCRAKREIAGPPACTDEGGRPRATTDFKRISDSEIVACRAGAAAGRDVNGSTINSRVSTESIRCPNERAIVIRQRCCEDHRPDNSDESSARNCRHSHLAQLRMVQAGKSRSDTE